MYFWFLLSILGSIAMVPLHFLSVEHVKLQGRHGKKKGIKIGKIYGLISGWGFFFFWMGVWVSPQPRFNISIFQDLSVFIPFVNFSLPLAHLIISAPFLVSGCWFGIKGVREITLIAAETHRTEIIVTSGSYSVVRHPQYLGGLLAHAGISFLLSAWFSLLFTPVMVVLIYFISKKEEEELIREFGKEYEDYKKSVPMMIPRLRK